MESSGENQSTSANRNNENASNPDEYTPWWSAGVRRSLDEEPISNVIGRARFIPDPRSKSILVLAPPQFHANIETMIPYYYFRYAKTGAKQTPAEKTGAMFQS